MSRVFISYAGSDSEAAMYIANQLRMKDIDVFIDYHRILDGSQFTRRLENEMLSRGNVIFVQSPQALQSPLVQTEIEYAFQNRIKIIPIALKPLNVRDTNEFRFLLNLKPIDFSSLRSNPLNVVGQITERLKMGHSDAVISVHNAFALHETAIIQKHESWVRMAAFSQDSMLLTTCAADEQIHLWDVRHMTVAASLGVIDDHHGMVQDLAFSPRQPYMVSAGTDGTIRFWDLNTLPTLYEYARIETGGITVNSLSFSPVGYLMASACQDHRAVIYDLSDLERSGYARSIMELLHPSHVYSVAFSPDGNLIASTSRDSAVRLWEIDTQARGYTRQIKPRTLQGHHSWVNAVAFAPHGLILAAASDDRTVSLWDVEHSEPIGRLTGHMESVTAISFSPDGSLLASASKDGTVRVWDLSSLQTLKILQGHVGRVNTVRFSPDGQTLVSGGGDATVRLWHIN